MTRKILLADDSLTIQKVVELTFSDSDYELVCVSNGLKALDRIRDDRPDLVLADVVMPEKNGYEVCEAIKSNPATARIPVLLLSGTFEPFDRERAERIGADAIVSKPFDSQQLIAQVEALLDNAPAGSSAGPPAAGTAVTAPVPAEPVLRESEEPPFDVGFSAEDFTASVRIPHRGVDPFEEEYGRGDADSAIEAFEKPSPQFELASEEPEAERPSEPERPISGAEEDAGREPLAQWLGDEPEKAAEDRAVSFEAKTAGEPGPDLETTAPIPTPLALPEEPAGEPSLTETSQPTRAASEVPEPPEEEQLEEEKEEILFDAAKETGSSLAGPAPFAPVGESPVAEAEELAAASEVPHDIEMLAQASSIPELTQMLSSVAKAGGSDLTDDQIEKLARRVVEKLSDRIVREIAWEVIPDMAEVVIKKRIKELEADIE